MNTEQFEAIKTILEEILEILKQDRQPQTKITVVGNKPQTTSGTKVSGYDPTEDFKL
jgi:dihydroneopterin aldolase